MSCNLPSLKALLGAIVLAMAGGSIQTESLSATLQYSKTTEMFSLNGITVSCGPFAKLCRDRIVEMKSCF